MYNVVDAIQTDSGNVSKNDKTDKEGSNLAGQVQNFDHISGNE
jgi:hypothetical protein